MKILHVDHIGIVVDDLEATKTFFVDLGFSVAGESHVEGDWVGKIIDLDDVRSDIVMLAAPDGAVNIELSKFQHPEAKSPGPNDANTLGLRHLAFLVDDLEAVVGDLSKRGYDLFGEMVKYKDIYKVCYIRGPEGIIVELAQKL